MRETRTVITTKCDRPRCGRVISEEEEDPLVSNERTPDLVIKRAGKPAIVYQDVCEICDNAIGGYCDKIEKKPAEKKEDPVVEPEPVDPGALRWDADNEEWVEGAGEVGVDCQAYAHTMGKSGRTTVIPELEGITDLEEARELIEAATTAGTGEPSDR